MKIPFISLLALSVSQAIAQAPGARDMPARSIPVCEVGVRVTINSDVCAARLALFSCRSIA